MSIKEVKKKFKKGKEARIKGGQVSIKGCKEHCDDLKELIQIEKDNAGNEEIMQWAYKQICNTTNEILKLATTDIQIKTDIESTSWWRKIIDIVGKDKILRMIGDEVAINTTRKYIAFGTVVPLINANNISKLSSEWVLDILSKQCAPLLPNEIFKIDENTKGQTTKDLIFAIIGRSSHATHLLRLVREGGGTEGKIKRIEEIMAKATMLKDKEKTKFIEERCSAKKKGSACLKNKCFYSNTHSHTNKEPKDDCQIYSLHSGNCEKNKVLCCEFAQTGTCGDESRGGRKCRYLHLMITSNIKTTLACSASLMMLPCRKDARYNHVLPYCESFKFSGTCALETRCTKVHYQRENDNLQKSLATNWPLVLTTLGKMQVTSKLILDDSVIKTLQDMGSLLTNLHEIHKADNKEEREVIEPESTIVNTNSDIINKIANGIYNRTVTPLPPPPYMQNKQDTWAINRAAYQESRGDRGRSKERTRRENKNRKEDRERSKNRERDRERSRNREKDRERTKNRERDRGRSGERTRRENKNRKEDRERSKNKEKDRERSRNRERDRERNRKRNSNREGDGGRSKDKEKEKESSRRSNNQSTERTGKEPESTAMNNKKRSNQTANNQIKRAKTIDQFAAEIFENLNGEVNQEEASMRSSNISADALTELQLNLNNLDENDELKLSDDDDEANAKEDVRADPMEVDNNDKLVVRNDDCTKVTEEEKETGVFSDSQRIADEIWCRGRGTDIFPAKTKVNLVYHTLVNPQTYKELYHAAVSLRGNEESDQNPAIAPKVRLELFKLYETEVKGFAAMKFVTNAKYYFSKPLEYYWTIKDILEMSEFTHPNEEVDINNSRILIFVPPVEGRVESIDRHGNTDEQPYTDMTENGRFKVLDLGPLYGRSPEEDIVFNNHLKSIAFMSYIFGYMYFFMAFYEISSRRNVRRSIHKFLEEQPGIIMPFLVINTSDGDNVNRLNALYCANCLQTLKIGGTYKIGCHKFNEIIRLGEVIPRETCVLFNVCQKCRYELAEEEDTLSLKKKKDEKEEDDNIEEIEGNDNVEEIR
jgi:hypothetical protein